jgi:hypothetical protein
MSRGGSERCRSEKGKNRDNDHVVAVFPEEDRMRH